MANDADVSALFKRVQGVVNVYQQALAARHGEEPGGGVVRMLVALAIQKMIHTEIGIVPLVCVLAGDKFKGHVQVHFAWPNMAPIITAA